MSMFPRSARFGALVFAGAMSIAGTLQATTITVNFSGTTGSNPGLLGAGAVAGSISYDTSTATSSGGAVFENVFSNIDFTTGAGTVTSSGIPTTNRLTQVQLTTGEDAFLSNYAGAFGATGVAGVAVQSVALELRTVGGGDFFDSTSDLFSSLTDGQVLTLGSDIGFFSLVVRYVGDNSLGTTIFRTNNLDAFTMTVSGDTVVAPVPLPAGAALLGGGLGLLGCFGRRSKRRRAAQKVIQ